MLDILRFAGAFILVVFLAYAGTTLLSRRWQGMSRREHLGLMESVSVGPKAHVVLLRTPRRHLILGVTERSITRLDSLADWEPDPGGTKTGGNEPGPEDRGVNPARGGGSSSSATLFRSLFRSTGRRAGQ